MLRTAVLSSLSRIRPCRNSKIILRPYLRCVAGLDYVSLKHSTKSFIWLFLFLIIDIAEGFAHSIDVAVKPVSPNGDWNEKH